jgi:hypothetical protein
MNKLYTLITCHSVLRAIRWPKEAYNKKLISNGLCGSCCPPPPKEVLNKFKIKYVIRSSLVSKSNLMDN